MYREKQREKETDRQTDIEKDRVDRRELGRERESVCVCV